VALPANRSALEREAEEVCLARHLRPAEALLERQHAVGVDVALELRAKRLPGGLRELARVVTRMDDLGAEPAGQDALGMAAGHDPLLFHAAVFTPGGPQAVRSNTSARGEAVRGMLLCRLPSAPGA